ncbi:hypothetical protein LF130101_1061 [Limosilactobacillus fermentum]|nr:hypothetical protein LF130101_1061 [Limosilactobacillus fermentum]
MTKDRDLRNLPDELVNRLMSKRNRIPRKSLDYRTPYEVFMEHITEDQLTEDQLTEDQRQLFSNLN